MTWNNTGESRGITMENVANIQAEAAMAAEAAKAPVEVTEPVVETETQAVGTETETETEKKTDEVVVGDDEPNGFKKRVDRVRAQVEAARQEAEYWKKIALEAQPKLEPEIKPVAVGKPVIDDFTDISDYYEALTEWKVEQKLAAKEEVAKKKQVVTSYQQRVTEFLKTTPDFDEVLADAGDVPAAPEIHQVIIESDVGPQLAYYLAQHPEEMQRINGLPAHRRLIEMGRLEDKVTPKKTEAIPEKKVSAAPAPIKAEKGAAPVKKDLNDPNLSQAEYRELRAKQLGRRYR